MQPLPVRPRQPAAAALAPARQHRQVAPVAVQCLPGQAALGPDRIQEPVDHPRIGIAQRRQLHGGLAAIGGSCIAHNGNDNRLAYAPCCMHIRYA